MGLLGPRESPYVTYGSEKIAWKEGFWVGKGLDGASWSQGEPLVVLV